VLLLTFLSKWLVGANPSRPGASLKLRFFSFDPMNGARTVLATFEGQLNWSLSPDGINLPNLNSWYQSNSFSFSSCPLRFHVHCWVPH
jgi:hypothetical protein